MCFPGGKRDAVDTDDVSTALREAQASSQLSGQQSAWRCGGNPAGIRGPHAPRHSRIALMLPQELTVLLRPAVLPCAATAAYCPVQEELGLDPAAVNVIACLPPFLSKHLLSVTPVIGIIPPHLKFTPNRSEVGLGVVG